MPKSRPNPREKAIETQEKLKVYDSGKVLDPHSPNVNIANIDQASLVNKGKISLFRRKVDLLRRPHSRNKDYTNHKYMHDEHRNKSHS